MQTKVKPNKNGSKPKFSHQLPSSHSVQSALATIEGLFATASNGYLQYTEQKHPDLLNHFTFYYVTKKNLNVFLLRLHVLDKHYREDERNCTHCCTFLTIKKFKKWWVNILWSHSFAGVSLPAFHI